MTKEELQDLLDENVHTYIDARVGTKYVTFDLYWARGANVFGRGDFNKTVRAEIPRVEKVAHDKYMLDCFIGSL